MIGSYEQSVVSLYDVAGGGSGVPSLVVETPHYFSLFIYLQHEPMFWDQTYTPQ